MELAPSRSGKSCLPANGGIGPITHFDATGFDCRIAAEVHDFDPLAWIPKKDLKKMGRFIQLAMAGADFAMRMAALEITPAIAEASGVYIASGIGGFDVIEREHSKLLEGGPGRISPFFIPAAIINLASGVHLHPLRRARTQFGDRDGLLGIGARGGGFVPPDPARRRGSHDLRRHRSGHHAHGRRRIRRDEGALHA